MTHTDRLGGVLPRAPITVELDDIQATVLRYRPEPYYGTHIMLHIEDAQAGREFLRRLTSGSVRIETIWRAPRRRAQLRRRQGQPRRSTGRAA